MLPLGPYVVSPTNPQPFQVEWDQVAQPPIGVDVQNQSGLLLKIKIGSQTLWLTPWTARFFLVDPNSQYVYVQPQILTALSGADPVTVTATLYQQGDIPPAIVERPLTGLAIASSITGTLTAAITGVVTTQTQIQTLANGNVLLTLANGFLNGAAIPAIPAWAKYLVFFLTIGSGPSGQVNQRLSVSLSNGGNALVVPSKTLIWSVSGSGITLKAAPTIYPVVPGIDTLNLQCITTPSGNNTVSVGYSIIAYADEPDFEQDQPMISVGVTATNASLLLVPIPDPGYMYRVNTITAQALGALTNGIRCSDPISGNTFLANGPLANGAAVIWPGPFDTTGVQVVSSNAAGVTFNTSYKQVLQVP